MTDWWTPSDIIDEQVRLTIAHEERIVEELVKKFLADHQELTFKDLVLERVVAPDGLSWTYHVRKR